MLSVLHFRWTDVTDRHCQYLFVHSCYNFGGQSLFGSPPDIQGHLSGKQRKIVKFGNVFVQVLIIYYVCGFVCVLVCVCVCVCVCVEWGCLMRPAVFSCTIDFLRKPWQDLFLSVFPHNIAQSPEAWQSQSSFYPHFISPLTPTLLPLLLSPYLLLLHHFLLSHRHSLAAPCFTVIWYAPCFPPPLPSLQMLVL